MLTEEMGRWVSKSTKESGLGKRKRLGKKLGTEVAKQEDCALRTAAERTTLIT